jgi:hypothetical protein
MANNYPALKPALNLDLVNGVYVDSRVTFTRAGTRTYFGQEMVKAEENLLLRSQEFDNAAWTKTAVTISANSTAAPDGTTTADTVTGSAGTTFKVVFPAAANTGLASAVATFSIFAKEGTHRYIQVSINGDATKYVNFDLNGSGATSAFGSGVTSSVTAAANGFVRCVVSLTGHPNTSRFYVSLQDSLAAAREASTASTGDIFLWGAQTELRSSATAYTATTTQPITRYQRLLKTAAANEWPREFDPVTGECLGRSVWEARTNLLLRSEEFDNASWTKTNATISANQLIAPDGTLSMDKLVEDTATSGHLINQVVTTLASATYALSFHVKAAGRSAFRISRAGGVVGVGFDLSTQQVVAAAGATGSIVSLGNDCYRCTIVFNTVVTNTELRFELQQTVSNAVQTYTGDGTSGIYIWGADFQAGAFPTPYIKTEAAQVTRLADSAVMTGVNFSSWFNPEQGTLFADYTAAAVVGGGSRFAFVMSDGTGNNRIGVGRIGDTADGSQIIFGGSVVASPVVAGAEGSARKLSAYYNLNDFNASIDGVLGVQDTSGNVPLVNSLTIGSNQVGAAANTLNGYIRRLTYYNQALTAANLQAITR